LGQASVRTVGVIVIDILGQNMAQVALSGNKDPVSAFAANAPDPAFGDRVGSRRQLHPILMIGTAGCG
jgi:hypothetical protein